MRGRQPKWIFLNFGDLLQPLEFVPTSRERVIPTEWQVHSVLGDCISMAKVLSIQAPQFRQFALISDFPDVANSSQREEAALATNWIKDRLQGLKLQNLALATITRPAIRSYPDNMTADVQHALNQCESLGSEKRLILYWNPSAITKDFFTAYLSSSTSFFCRVCIWSAV